MLKSTPLGFIPVVLWIPALHDQSPRLILCHIAAHIVDRRENNMTESNTCSTCGGELLANSGQTFCPACLLQQGMKSSTYGGGSKPAWKPPEMEQLAAAFPQLEIQQLLGVGGMGAVYKVRQKELDRVAALKVLPGEMAVDAGFTERFLREARLLASLGHPHIVTVYEFGERNGIYFLLMEFVDGVTLRQALRAEPIRKLDSKEALAIVGQLCDALQFAHDEGVVHRDIKPENILIDKRGRVKIADFGLAKLLGQSPTMPTLTGPHQLLGTPVYMAPEQIEGLPGIDHRADIYSMGVVFYELLTGELPLGRFSPPSERAETDVRLDEVVFRTLAKDPGRRYQQASHVKTDVESFRSSETGSAPLAKNHRRLVWIAVAAFVIGVLILPLILFTPSVLHIRRENKRNAAFEVNLRAGQARGAARAEAALQRRDSHIEPTYRPAAILIDESGPTVNAAEFSLSAEQLLKVNVILKTIRACYLKEEALHSVFSVDIAGVQTTRIEPFPDQLRQIEHDLWTQLDAVVTAEPQKQVRVSFDLFSSSRRMDHRGFGMGISKVDDKESPRFFGSDDGLIGSPNTDESMSRFQPGLLGWRQDILPIQVQIDSREVGYAISVASQIHAFNPKYDFSELPEPLRRFYREPGPWIAVAKAKTAYETKNWMQVADAFTRGGRFRWYLNAEATTDGSPNKLPQFSIELARLHEFFERTRPPIEKDEEILRLLEEIKTLIRKSSANAVGGLCQQGGQTFSEDLGKAWFLFSVIDAATRKTVIFEPATYSLEGVQIDERNNAKGQLVSPDGTQSVPIKFLFLDEQWKIDSIGSDEELQKQLQLAEQAAEETPPVGTPAPPSTSP
jgi:predicted Ser/Thr protein kinase